MRERTEKPQAPSIPEERVRNVMHRSILLLVVATSILTLLGLLMVFSAITPGAVRAEYEDGPNLFRSAYLQMAYAAIGTVLAVICARIPLAVFQRLWGLALGFGILLQGLVLTPLGASVAGNRNWIAFGPIRLQPSEFLKLAMVVALAAVLGRMVQGAHFQLSDWSGPIAITGASIGAVLVGGDMGTALIFLLIGVGMFWMAGFPGRYFLISGALGFFLVVVLIFSSRSRITRIQDFFQNLFTLPTGQTPSQADYALWAFGSGGPGGSGLGTGIEKWPGNLAEAHTDFIFAVVGEELGFFGCAVVIVLLGTIGYALLTICMYHPHRFGRFVAGGATLWLCGQAVANMFVVTGLLPVFGVPLPFMSQGGSSVISCLMAVGVCVAAALAVPGVKESFRRSSSLAGRVRAVIRRTS
ncbi:FtsW/RodA/SpoVE family cell cycle protein [Actinotignum schaalii]|uniref:FtsW/RodA/SpoVE family cell cycle protein n=1 Tax=Actinomycetaceae TaxID=2049 RepID=UPI00237DCF75|nr:FtsW/RodA/SpoVE family cell cycle protein [Actinotignum schaalii]MDE1653765.1 FtsW/RodA/SpoVE family cell cycle protein [Actinotignum schaalii]